MRSHERIRGLLRAHKLTWDVLCRGRYSFDYDLMPMTARRMPAAKRFNLLKAGMNLIYRRAMPWSMPLHLQIETTNYCNLRCPVCPSGIRSVDRKPRAIDVALCERLIDEVGPYLLTVSMWAWGEPLLHPKLEAILRVVRKHDIAILLSTNGQNLDDERVVEALTREPPTYLIVAIDGLTDETNSRFRVGAKLAPVLEGVRRIAAIKKQRGLQTPVLHMRFIAMKHNQHEVPQLAEFARRHDFDMLTLRTLSIIDSESTERTHRDLLPNMNDLRAYDYDGCSRVERGDFVCQEPFWFPTVFADGTLVACEQDFNAQQPLGIVSEDASFAELWYSDHAARVRKRIRDRPDDLSFCANCPYRDRDNTHCSVRAHFLNDAIDYPHLVPAGA